MRIFVAISLLCLFSMPAFARNCSNLLDYDVGTFMGGDELPSRAFYLCLLAEIADLKAKQAEMELIGREYKRLMSELPAHYTNQNGRIDFEKGRKIGSASFVLKSRQLGGANSLKLDQTVIQSVCPAPVGCLATISYREFGMHGDETLNSRMTGPCVFQFEAFTRTWTVGSGCGSDHSISGKDGDGSAVQVGSGAAIVMEAGPGCLFADSDIKPSASNSELQFATDHAQGFFLIADPSRRAMSSARFECDLAIK
jgi:hypothetical protein